MSLEAKIELLTAAVRDLIDVMHNQQGVVLQQIANPTHIALDEDGRAAAYKLAEAERSAKEEVPNDPAQELKKSSTTTDTLPPSSQASVTYDDVKADAATHEAIINEKTEVPNEKSSPTTDTSPPSSTESQAVTYDDVKAVTIAVSKIDKAKAIAGLARFGAKNAKELTDAQWSDYVVYMKRVAAGEIDPESSHE